METTGSVTWPNHLVRFAECYFVELMLLICSATLALKLFAFPDESELCARGHDHVTSLINERLLWGTVAAFGCTIKIVGLALLRKPAWWQLSVLCRYTGLFMSSLLWSIFGIAYLIDCPYEIGGLQMVLMGLSAGALKWTLNAAPLLNCSGIPSRTGASGCAAKREVRQDGGA